MRIGANALAINFAPSYSQAYEPTEVILLSSASMCKNVKHSGRSESVSFRFPKHNLVGRLSALAKFYWCAGARLSFRHGAALLLIPTDEPWHAWKGWAAEVVGQRPTASQCQSQRVAIARALMQRPDIVLADEPAASLDPQAGDEVMRLFLSLMREERKTVVFTSHNLNHALDYADRVVGLSEGKIVLDMLAAGLKESDLRGLYV